MKRSEGLAHWWNTLSRMQQAAVLALGAGDAALRVAALADLAHRPTHDVRGPKWIWASILVIVNSAGVLPATYLLYGRRTHFGSWR